MQFDSKLYGLERSILDFLVTKDKAGFNPKQVADAYNEREKQLKAVAPQEYFDGSIAFASLGEAG